MSNATLSASGGSGGVGDVVGPSSSMDNGIVRYDGTTGKLIKDSNLLMVNGTGSTSGAVTDDLITVALGGSAGVYRFEVYCMGFESTTPAGVGFTLRGSARTTGAAASVFDIPDVDIDVEAALTGSDIELVASANNIIVRVTGVAALDIDWAASMQYRSIIP